MFLARLSVNNPVVANLLMLAIVILGVLSFLSMPRELMSELSLNWVFIAKPYPGVSPEEIERLIVVPIEEEIQDVKGIESIASQCGEGTSLISVRFKEMSDDEFRKRYEDLRAELEKVKNLPQDALDTQILSFTTSEMAPMIFVHLHGKVSEKKLLELGKELRRNLLEIPRIAKVDMTGARDREIWVEADPVRLEGYGLSTEHLRQAIAARGVNVPAGRLNFGRQELYLRTIGQFENLDDIKRVIVRSGDNGQTVRVGDVADVSETFEEEETRSRHKREPVITMTVTKQSDGNSIEMTKKVRRIAEEFESRYNNSVSVSFTMDSSEQIRDILGKLSRNAWAGFAIVVIVLMAFLGLRNAVLAALGIPISFLACFIFMHRTGSSFNGNSLFGLVLVLGIIVDDAIIIVENCYRHLQAGKSWRQAAIEGTGEVMGPVFSATATTIAAFLPLMLLPGIVGKFMRIIPVAVSLALVASMVEAFLILPSHFADWPGKGKKTLKREWGLMKSFRRLYGKALVVAVRRRYLFALGIPLPLILLVALVIIPRIGVDMFAGEEVAAFQIRVTMPTGTNLETTSGVLEQFERIAEKIPKHEVRAVHTTAGLIQTDDNWYFRTEFGQLWISLTPSYERKRTADQIMDGLRDDVTKISGPLNIEFAKVNTGPPVGKPVEIKVKGKYFHRLEAAAKMIKDELGKIDGVTDVGDDYEAGKQEVRFRVDPERAALYNLSVGQVGMAIRQAISGEKAETMYDGDEDIEIKVRVAKEFFKRPEDLLRLPLATPTGAVVSLGNVASYTLEKGVVQINRYKQQRTITVHSNLDKSKTDIVIVNRKIQEKFDALASQFPGVTLDFSGEFREFRESFKGLLQLFAFGILLVYTILAAQFRSYIQPIVILLTIPLAAIGACFGMLISGNPFSITTMFGIVALAGIAVNDAIVLVSFVNKLKADGVPAMDAVVEAGRLRLRPIILTSVTTIAGLVPMAIGLGGASLTWSPLANTIVWGLSFGTALMLFLVPAAYVIIVEDIVGRLFPKRREEEELLVPTKVD